MRKRGCPRPPHSLRLVAVAFCFFVFSLLQTMDASHSGQGLTAFRHSHWQQSDSLRQRQSDVLDRDSDEGFGTSLAGRPGFCLLLKQFNVDDWQPVLDPFNLLTATPINPVAAPTPGSVPIYTDPIHSQTPDTVRARSTVPPMCIPSWSTVVRSSGRVISAHVSSELTFYKPLTSS